MSDRDMFGRVYLMEQPDPIHGDRSFQYVPPEPLSAGHGQLQRSASFAQIPQAIPPTAPASQRMYDPHHYISVISGNAGNVAAIGPSLLIIPKNDLKRNCLGFRNTIAAGGSNVLVDFGQPANANSWLLLAPQQIVFFDEGVMQDDVYVIGSAFPWAVSFIYSTIPNN